jgi:His-Xaa-Ser system radical SAM maturase HxsC
MKPLTLRAATLETNGLPDSPGSIVFRANALSSNRAASAQDAALVHNAQDCAQAISLGYQTALLRAEADPGADALERFNSFVRLPKDLGYVEDGDVLGFFGSTGRARVLYRRASKHNSFLVTERCNHYCLMCSQPPKRGDDSWILDEIAAAIPLIHPETRSLGFTGGETLTDWERFIPLLAQARDCLPDTALHVLSNGRAFAQPEITAAWAAVGHPNLCVGIPLYASTDHLHDYVVQARGAFDETVLGILRLKDKRQRVEIRVVLHKLTIPALVETCTWIARNLPFVDHVALMGLENTGFALANQDLLWIDPDDYRGELALAVDILTAAEIKTSIYNLPLCLIERPAWRFAVQSISDWKNAHLPECTDCSVRAQCAGFFTTGRLKTSRGIQPIAA